MPTLEVQNSDLKEKSQRLQFYSGPMMPVMQNLNTLNYVFITIVGALLAIFRGFDVGGLAAFLQYSRQFGARSTNSPASTTVSRLLLPVPNVSLKS